jgi:hypothetical protein
MRISAEKIAVLTALVSTHFGRDARLRLFGSRVDDRQRGGDIDLHVIAPQASYRDEVAFLVDVERLLDERVDIRVQRGDPLLIDKIARDEGVSLSG